MSKGIIFSLDVLMALLLAVIFSTFIFFNINQSYSNYDGLFLHKVAIDTLSVLREDTSLETFNNASISAFFSAMPEQYCVNLTIYDSIDRISYNSIKLGCISEGKTVGVARRVFIANSTSIYLAEVKMWYE